MGVKFEIIAGFLKQSENIKQNATYGLLDIVEQI